ncbi:MAG: polynucleotide adenylyltransferase PcnB [Brachymonas sp.]|jgi:poly(A) polymerase
MIKRIIGKIIASTAGKNKKLGRAVEIPSSQHRINHQLLEPKAVEVVRTLKNAGFDAYIVGGAVRDLVLGVPPKDFDVATSATPEQVKALFRRAFIIGRRFRIVHVVFGRGREHEVIEVSTFRALLDNTQAEKVSGNEKTSKAALAGMKHAVDEHGRVLRDNVWGSQEEDAARRDFTINAMYYDPERQVIVDYHNGFADCQRHIIQLIGEPATRYREDPVRILRAVRFAAKLEKLGFQIEKKTASPIASCKALLADIPQSRMFDETLKLLQTGHAEASLRQLRLAGLVGGKPGQGIYPLLDLIAGCADAPLVQAALRDTDRRIQEGKSAAAYFLLACVLWEEVEGRWHELQEVGEHIIPALSTAIDEVFDRRIGDVSGRGKLAADMREVWMMQPRFERRTPSGAPRLLENFRFRAAYDFYRLRAAVEQADMAIADWWEEFSTAEDEDARADLLVQVPKERSHKIKKSGPKNKAKISISSEKPAVHAPELGAEKVGVMTEQAPAKRRRRRSKPKPDAADSAEI